MWQRGQANARRISVLHNTVALPNLPGAFDGFRILHLTDLHLDMDRDATHNIIAAVREVDYDICVMTGDYRARTHGDSKPAMALMGQLRAQLKDPIYAVLGNHDSIVSVEAMEALGIHMLMNESDVIERDGQSIGIAGVDDGHYFQMDDADKALAGIRKQPVKLLLSHTPETYQSAAAAGADMPYPRWPNLFARRHSRDFGSTLPAPPRQGPVALSTNAGLHVGRRQHVGGECAIELPAGDYAARIEGSC